MSLLAKATVRRLVKAGILVPPHGESYPVSSETLVSKRDSSMPPVDGRQWTGYISDNR